MAETVGLQEEVPRRVRDVVQGALRDFPVVALEGPRSVGKSTLLRSLADAHAGQLVDLDDLDIRESVQSEPGLYVRGDGPVFVDEFRRVPEVLDAIKTELNRDGSAGHFVITGSTRYTALPMQAQSLTGRVRRIEVGLLSVGEVTGVEETFVAMLTVDPSNCAHDSALSTTTREEYAEQVVAGGFPIALQLPTRSARLTWFDEYVALVLSRDVLELSRIRQRRRLPVLLNRLAAQTASVLKLAEAASAAEIDKGTAEDYVQLLEAVFMVRRVPAWGTTLGARVSSSSKLHVLDSGIAARLLRLTPERLLAADPAALTEFGHLLETFVVGEIHKQVSWLSTPLDIGHFRTRDGEEVALVLEGPDGSVTGVEVKASARVKGAEKGFAALRRRAGDRFAGGVLLYLGDRVVRLGDGVLAVPVDRLWKSGPAPSSEMPTAGAHS